MKKRFLRFGYVGIALLVFCFAIMISIARPSEAEQKSITLAGYGTSYSGEENKVVVTLVESKPGIYTANGTLYLGPTWSESFPIKGTYYEESGALKATAKDPENQSVPLVVDGYSVKSELYKTRMDVTIKSGSKVYFEGMISSEDRFPAKGTEPKDKTASTEAKSDEDKVPAVEGKEPSPPEKQEQWNGWWKGKEKVTFVTELEGAPPQIREGEFEMQVVREGSTIRLIGYGAKGKETALKLTPGNPNVAMMKKEWTSAVADAVGLNKETLVVFLRDDRLYMTQRLTMAITAKKTTTHVTSDTIGIADRVK